MPDQGWIRPQDQAWWDRQMVQEQIRGYRQINYENGCFGVWDGWLSIGQGLHWLYYTESTDQGHNEAVCHNCSAHSFGMSCGPRDRPACRLFAMWIRMKRDVSMKDFSILQFWTGSAGLFVETMDRLIFKPLYDIYFLCCRSWSQIIEYFLFLKKKSVNATVFPCISPTPLPHFVLSVPLIKLLNIFPTTEGYNTSACSRPFITSTYLLSLITNPLRKLRTPNTLTLIRTNLLLTPQFRSIAWCMMIRSSGTTIRRLDIAHPLCFSREKVTEEAGCVAFLLVFCWAVVWVWHFDDFWLFWWSVRWR